MILLWGTTSDTPIAAIAAALDKARQPYVVVDSRRVLDIEVEVRVDRQVEGWVNVGGRMVPLADVTAAYVRPPDPTRVRAVRDSAPSSAERRHAWAVHEALRVFTELTTACVVNRLSVQGSNGSKPYQARAIAASGLKVPETLVTTDADAVGAFADEHGEVIYKSVSGIRSVVGVLDSGSLARLRRVANCPTQFQRRIPGTDHRAHVIGDEVLTTRVESPAVDYRYASRLGAGVKLESTRLPPEVEDQCRSLARALRLQVAGIDLRRTPDGEWYCFEANPSPAFTFYDEPEDGRPRLAARIAALLSAGGERGRWT